MQNTNAEYGNGWNGGLSVTHSVSYSLGCSRGRWNDSLETRQQDVVECGENPYQFFASFPQSACLSSHTGISCRSPGRLRNDAQRERVCPNRNWPPAGPWMMRQRAGISSYGSTEWKGAEESYLPWKLLDLVNHKAGAGERWGCFSQETPSKFCQDLLQGYSPYRPCSGKL